MFAAGTVRVAAVPNAWVNDDLPELGSGTSFEQIVSEMALAGYAGTELGSTYPTDAAVLNAALGVRGLSPSGGWVSTWFASKGGAYEQTLQTFRDQIPFFNAIGLLIPPFATLSVLWEGQAKGKETTREELRLAA